jgi:hypothetical protein
VEEQIRRFMEGGQAGPAYEATPARKARALRARSKPQLYAEDPAGQGEGWDPDEPR